MCILKFERFDYQIIVEGSLVIVLDSKKEAKNYVSKNFPRASAIILPIAVFRYQ